MNLQSFKEKIFRKAGGDFNNIEVSDDNFTDILSDLMKRYMNEHADGAFQQVYALTVIENQHTYTLPSNIVAVVGYYKAQVASAAGYPSLQKYLYERDNQLFTNDDLADYALFEAYLNDIDIMTGIEFDFHYSTSTKQLTILNTQEFEVIYFRVWSDLTDEFSEDIYDDEFFVDWVLGYFMKTWWRNIKKYKDRPLIGGTRLNLEDLKQDADELIERCEDRLRNELSEPAEFLF